MAEGAQKIKVDENYNYTANIPSVSVALGLIGGYAYGIVTTRVNNYPLRYGVIKFMPKGLAGGLLLGVVSDYLMTTYHKNHKRFTEEYVQKFPEDFVQPTPQKFESQLLPWNPIR